MMTRWLWPIATLAMVCGCSGTAPLLPRHVASADAPAVELTAVPFFAQERYQCGPAALAMLLAESDVDVTPAELTPQIYLPGRRGSLQAELVAAMRRHDRMPYPVRGGLDGLLAQLRAHRPVLVLQNLGRAGQPRWHYAVVIGYSLDADEVLLHSGTTAGLRVPARAFARSWDLGGRWGYVALRPGELPAAAEAEPYVAAAADLEATGHLGAAFAAYTVAVRQWPHHTLARLGLGNTLYALGDSEAAEGAFRDLLEDEPWHVVARNNLASVLAERGCTAEARGHIAIALAQPDVAPPLRALLQQTAAGIDSLDSTGGACRGATVSL